MTVCEWGWRRQDNVDVVYIGSSSPCLWPTVVTVVTPPVAAATAAAEAAAAAAATDIGLVETGMLFMFSMFSLFHAPFIVLEEEKQSFMMNGNFVPGRKGVG